MEHFNSWAILIPIWGDMHIKMCANFVLPSLLATENLPELSKKAKLTIRFLTTEPSSNALARNPIHEKLSNFATVKYCFIDDLVNLGDYGLTLTMAYERGIQIDAPEDQIQTTYIFLNGDLLISNNTFKTLFQKITDGYNAIVSPGVRVVEQELTGILEHKKNLNSGVIDCDGRELVKHTLAHLHPTVIAAMVDNKQISTSISHQYFIQVNSELLIARFFLLFMLCIKPERPLPMVTGHCDYSFIPELCPSENYAVITDSDDAFLMELAPLEQESKYIHFSNNNASIEVTRMQRWVTKEHMKFSNYTLFFKAAELSEQLTDVENLHQAKKALSEKLDQVHTILNLTPRVSHEYHPFWNNQINLYKNQGKLSERQSINFKKGIVNRLLHLCSKYILGNAPFVTRFHYKYQDYKNCMHTLNEAINDAQECKLLYVCGSNKDIFKSFFDSKRNLSVNLIRIDDINNITDISSYDLIFLETNEHGFNKFSSFMLKSTSDIIVPTIVFVDFINANPSNASITPYLSLLSRKVQFITRKSALANQKLPYYKFSVKFMHELYGNRNLLKMAYFFTAFAITSIMVTLRNIANPSQTDKVKIENLSSLVLRF